MTEIELNDAVSSEQSNKPTGFDRFTLTVQFLIAGSVVLLMGMLAIGNWVTQEIENGVTRNKAASTALYIESFVAPRVQELATSNRVLPKTKSELDRVFNSGDLRTRIVTFKIWKKNGLLAYSSRPQMIGKQFPITDELMRSWAGEVTAEFDSLGDEEDALERAQGIPLLEIYSPICEPSTGRVIAVAEFYETAAALQKNLLWARVKSWLAVAGASLLMMLALSGIVIRGSRTIERQRAQVQARVEELSNLLHQNEALRTRLQVLSNRVAESNERNLGRIGSNLHDGPAQLISFALLRLDSLKLAMRKSDPGSNDPEEIISIRDALKHAMSEILELCANLTLAKLEDM